MNPVRIAEILEYIRLLTEFVGDYYDHFRTRVLKYSAPEWRSMVSTILAVARKLCELQGQRTMLRECIFDLTNIRFIFRSEENERWNKGTFVLFLLKVPHIDPQMAFILMSLIQWVVEYPNLVSCFRRCFREREPYCDLDHSYQDGQEVLIQNTGNFVNFLIGTNDNFQQVLPAPSAIRTSFFGKRLKLCRMDVPLFLVVSSRKRRKMMVISGMSLKVLQKFFQNRLCNYGFGLMLPDFVTRIKKN
jgi:hypothetical protein